MNIFVLDEDPRLAAQYHNDRHCVKMILETAQLLCTAHVMLDGETTARKRIGDLILRPTHANHPCAIWTRESDRNYVWLHSLGIALLAEYRRRYGKDHSYTGLFERLRTMPMLIPFTGIRTPFPQCMPDQYKQINSPVTAYRLYYFHEKRHIATWKAPAGVPKWWTAMQAVDDAYKEGAA